MQTKVVLYVAQLLPVSTIGRHEQIYSLSLVLGGQGIFFLLCL